MQPLARYQNQQINIENWQEEKSSYANGRNYKKLPITKSYFVRNQTDIIETWNFIQEFQEHTSEKDLKTGLQIFAKQIDNRTLISKESEQSFNINVTNSEKHENRTSLENKSVLVELRDSEISENFQIKTKSSRERTSTLLDHSSNEEEDKQRTREDKHKFNGEFYFLDENCIESLYKTC